ncbi:DUF4406 domain-containing protein [Kitasatospora acidiphila]|uniref:DUF4406 domain-containing protein n=1 Tax=Kitasatospora acidiphila TaxID=2567942 RepID=UPI0015F03C6C|nr:DUF4406 domain-containing protein [Kitasatospora acidiphila]
MPDAVYISGPMRGLPNFNYDLFNSVADSLRQSGMVVLNPAENFDGDQSREISEYIRADVQMLLKASMIFLLPGWQDSEGARLEYLVAKALGLEIVHHADADPTEPAEMTAARIVRNGERQAVYGHPSDDFRRTAKEWSAVFGREVQPLEVAIGMVQLKLSRLIGTPGHRDSIIDAIGYMICYERIIQHG